MYREPCSALPLFSVRRQFCLSVGTELPWGCSEVPNLHRAVPGAPCLCSRGIAAGDVACYERDFKGRAEVLHAAERPVIPDASSARVCVCASASQWTRSRPWLMLHNITGLCGSRCTCSTWANLTIMISNKAVAETASATIPRNTTAR